MDNPRRTRLRNIIYGQNKQNKNVKIFVVTQSPEFIDALVDKGNVILVRQEMVEETPLGIKPATKGTSLKAKDIQLIESLIAELGSARILFANVVFLVEGGDDASLLRHWINSNRQRLRHLRRYSTDMIPYSRIGIKNVARSLKSLRIKFFAFLDGDKQGKEDYRALVKERVAKYAFQWSVADILGFVDGAKLAQAIDNVIRRLGIEKNKLTSELTKNNAYKNYQGSVKKIKDGSLKKEEGKEAFEVIISILFENLKEIKEKYYDKRDFRDRFKHVLGSELMKFRLETPDEVIGFLGRMDEMVKP